MDCVTLTCSIYICLLLFITQLRELQELTPDGTCTDQHCQNGQICVVPGVCICPEPLGGINCTESKFLPQTIYPYSLVSSIIGCLHVALVIMRDQLATYNMLETR